MFTTDPEVLRVVREWVEKAEYESIPLAEARNAVKAARRVRRQIRIRLPKEALRAK